MRKTLSIVFILMALMGCEFSNKKKFEFGCDNIEHIDFFEIKQGEVIFRKKIDDKITIKKIVNCVQNSREEIIKFIPKWKLIFYCHDNQFSITTSGTAMSGQYGVKYRLGCSIESVLGIN